MISGRENKKVYSRKSIYKKTIFYVPYPLNVLEDKRFFRHRFSLSQANLL